MKQKEIQVRPSGEGLLKQGGSGCSFLLSERAARERAARDRATEKGGGVGASLRGERRARGKGGLGSYHIKCGGIRAEREKEVGGGGGGWRGGGREIERVRGE